MEKRGKAKATKEDVSAITELIKEVESRHAHDLARLSEALRTHGTMRASIVERRMKAHQKAYALSMRMLQKLYSAPEEREGVRRELSEFWSKNCLYLDERARTAFDAAWVAFLRHPTLLEMPNRPPFEVVERNFKLMTALGPTLVETASLPALKVDESGAASDRQPILADPDLAESLE